MIAAAEEDAPARARAWRAAAVPIASTLAASAMGALPIVAAAPVMPPLGLLAALGWRLLRPELWLAWAALPLGLADDLVSGNPIGTAMAAWTAIFLALDLIDRRLPWRDWLLDWGIAALAVSAAMAFAVLGAGGGRPELVTCYPQILLTILCFPAMVRACAALDRWRLSG